MKLSNKSKTDVKATPPANCPMTILPTHPNPSKTLPTPPHPKPKPKPKPKSINHRWNKKATNQAYQPGTGPAEKV